MYSYLEIGDVNRNLIGIHVYTNFVLAAHLTDKNNTTSWQKEQKSEEEN